MKSWLFRILLRSGSGFLFSTLLTELVLFLSICYVTWKILIPVLRNYRLAKHLDRLCDTVPRHWFHGHLVNVSVDIINCRAREDCNQIQGMVESKNLEWVDDNCKYSQTSVFERLGVRTNRFSNGKFEMKMTRSSHKNSVLEQLKRKIYLNQRDRE